MIALKRARSVIVAVFVGAVPMVASAHSYLVRSEPADGSVAAPPPQTLRLTFGKPIEANFAKITVLHEGKAAAPNPAPEVDAAGTTVTVPLQSPEPGHYRIEWSVLGRDGHRTNGAFSFEAKAK